jgi:uncharacterized cupin superfamily protein
VSERIFNLRELELEQYDEGPAGHRFTERSPAQDLGAKLTGLSVYELEPGEATWPYHFELVEEEWVIVVEGEITLRSPDGERVLRAGDVVCFPTGPAGAHAMRNAGSSTAQFAMPSGAVPSSATIYPDSGKFGIHGSGFRHRGKLGEHVEYWDGEV